MSPILKGLKLFTSEDVMEVTDSQCINKYIVALP
jgi:hypothetical protein